MSSTTTKRRTSSRKASARKRPRRSGLARSKRALATRWGGTRRAEEKLPGWSDLASPKRSKGEGYLEQVSTVRFAGLLLLMAVAFTLYVGHVHATQALVVRLHEAQQDNQQLHLKLGRLRGEFDRAVGPRVIYERASALGLEEGVAYAPTITLDKADSVP